MVVAGDPAGTGSALFWTWFTVRNGHFRHNFGGSRPKVTIFGGSRPKMSIFGLWAGVGGGLDGDRLDRDRLDLDLDRDREA